MSWGMQLLVDAIEHWEKRNLDALEMLNPARLDRDELGAYFEQYPGRLADLVDERPVRAGVAVPDRGERARPARRVRGDGRVGQGRHRAPVRGLVLLRV